MKLAFDITKTDKGKYKLLWTGCENLSKMEKYTHKSFYTLGEAEAVRDIAIKEIESYFLVKDNLAEYSDIVKYSQIIYDSLKFFKNESTDTLPFTHLILLCKVRNMLLKCTQGNYVRLTFNMLHTMNPTQYSLRELLKILEIYPQCNPSPIINDIIGNQCAYWNNKVLLDEVFNKLQQTYNKKLKKN